MHGHIWPCMAMHGHAWPYVAIHVIKKSENRQQISKSPKIKISFRCAKLRENPENQGFMFFAVLPSYFGVSDSLAYSKRQGLKRSIDWYKKFLISCLAARYSAVFVFKSMEIHGNPCRSTRSTLQKLICYRMKVSRASGTPCGSVFKRFCIWPSWSSPNELCYFKST